MTFKIKRKKPSNYVNMVNRRFGKLTVISRNGTNKWGQAMWKCQCECGNLKTISGAILRRGTSRSCGCLAIELMTKRQKTHGMSKTHIYGIWNGINMRCINKNHISHPNYGARGIRVCDEWKNSFEKFFEWAIINGYKKELQIDRIDNNGDYCPQNCRFVTPEINGNNTRKSRVWIVYNIPFLSTQRAAQYFEVSKKTIRNWCLGDKQSRTPPRPLCKAPLIYKDND